MKIDKSMNILKYYMRNKTPWAITNRNTNVSIPVDAAHFHTYEYIIYDKIEKLYIYNGVIYLKGIYTATGVVEYIEVII